jgi:hypothetical protein
MRKLLAPRSTFQFQIHGYRTTIPILNLFDSLIPCYLELFLRSTKFALGGGSDAINTHNVDEECAFLD